MNNYEALARRIKKSMAFGFVGYCLLGAAPSLANMNDEIKAYRAQGAQQGALTSMEQINALKNASIQNQADNKTLIDTLMQSTRTGLQTKQKPQGVEGAVLFVSFSMPETLLFALTDEAAQFNIPLVINGLVDGDFKKTISTFKHLNNEAKKQNLNFKGLSIDPVWFTQFQIKSVPALVVTSPQHPCSAGSRCSDQSFDVVYGNIKLKQALKLIAQKGEAASLSAQAILENGHV